MANDTLGTDLQLKFQIPQKGNTDWSETIKEAFRLIAEHDHSATATNQNGKGVQLNIDNLASDTVNVDALKTYTSTLTGPLGGASHEDVLKDGNPLTFTENVVIIQYKVKQGSNYQCGTLEGIVGNSLVDSYIGSNLVSFQWNSTTLQVAATAGDILTYKIEFAE